MDDREGRAAPTTAPHQPAPGADATPARRTAQRFQGEMDAGMAKMMADMHAAGFTGDPDVDFLAMMIPHHAGAIEMARLLLLHGKDPLTRRLAADIIASQSSEIAAMRQRLAILRRPAAPDGSGGEAFPPLEGTRGGDF